MFSPDFGLSVTNRFSVQSTHFWPFLQFERLLLVLFVHQDANALSEGFDHVLTLLKSYQRT